MKKKTKLVCIGITFSILFTTLMGCSGNKQESLDNNVKNAMEGIEAQALSTNEDLENEDTIKIANFSVEIFKNCLSKDKNTLVSPYSILSALTMVANGADNETKNEFETVFNSSILDMDKYLKVYTDKLPSADKYKVNNANSIWINEIIEQEIEEDFLQLNANYFDASVYSGEFNNQMKDKINKWVYEKTNGMIDEVIDEIPNNAMMYLVNALAFDAEWENIYKTTDIYNGKFTTVKNEKVEVEMMHSSEYKYLDDGGATGFIKYYADKKYAFVALLPNTDIAIEDYINDMTGEGLLKTINSASSEEVITTIPKFESEFNLELNDVLIEMDLKSAFDEKTADFSKLIKKDNLYIGRCIHKTYISVDEKGTKAGAVTAVEMKAEGMMPTEPKSVCLDRSFVYAIIECENNLPLFIGSMLE